MIELRLSYQRDERSSPNDLQAERARIEKVEQIRASLEAGTYYVPAEQVADKIIDRVEKSRT